MGRSKTLPRKRTLEDVSNSESSFSGRRSLPSTFSIDAMIMIELEQVRIAEQHRIAMRGVNHSTRTTPVAAAESSTTLRKRRKKKRRSKKSVSFGPISIIGPPELEMILNEEEQNKDDSACGRTSEVWRLCSTELSTIRTTENLRFIRTVHCHNVELIPAHRRIHYLTSPQSSVDALSKVFPSITTLDQRQNFYLAVKKQHIVVCLDPLDGVVVLSIALTETGWHAARKMSKHHQRPLEHHFTKLMACLFTDLDNDHSGNEFSVEQFYKLFDNRQLLLSSPTPSNITTGLKPTLRPYQSAAVAWMLRRERETTSNEWKLAWVVLDPTNGTVQSLCTRANGIDDDNFLYYCPSTGWFADTLDMAHAMIVPHGSPPVRGGILAESMGLGKTVEVLACIMANPCPDELTVAQANKANNIVDAGASVSSGVDESLDDQASLDDDVHRSQKHCAVAVVTPERKIAITECWMDEDILGGCICGELICFSKERSRGDIVVCRSCKGPMHYQCAYIRDFEEGTLEKMRFRQRFTNSRINGFFCPVEVCPSCAPERISKASLIITPIAILNQWEQEVQRHTQNSNKTPLKVILYDGIKKSSGDRSKSKFMHPRYLLEADIVLVSFEALRTDLGHVESTQASDVRLRRRKHYRIARSPLISLIWWRVCLDEAQRVESTATGAAKVAFCLRARNRWCVSGTPIGRGKLDDLYGLLLFLGLKPFDDIVWFRRCLQRPSRGFNERIIHLLQDIFWRSTKELDSVCAQMNIPAQIENRIILKFSSVEKHFYNKQLERTQEVAGTIRERNLIRRKNEAKLVSSQLHMLRAACCHPQVGSRGIASIRKRGISNHEGVNSRVMTMSQILDKLTEDAKVQCEEAQRLAIMHTNAMAAISRLTVDARKRGVASCKSDEALLKKSCEHYMESLSLANENAKPTIVTGEMRLQGSVGFLDSGGFIDRGRATLEWRTTVDCTNEFWANFTFSSEQRSLSEVRLRQLRCSSGNSVDGISSELVWDAIRLQNIELQCVGQSGEFATIETLSLSNSLDTMHRWTSMKGFRDNKSKTWRIVVKVGPRSETKESNVKALETSLALEVELYEAAIANDPLQRLHCLHNAAISLKEMSSLTEKINAGDDNEPSEKADLLQQSLAMDAEASFIEKAYLIGARDVRSNAKLRFRLLFGQRQQVEATSLPGNEGTTKPELTDCWELKWWDDFLSACHLKASETKKRLIYDRLIQELDGSLQGTTMGSTVNEEVIPFPAFNDLNGFLVAMRLRLQSIRRGLGDWKKHPHLLVSRPQRDNDQRDAFASHSGRFRCPIGAHSACMRKISNLSDDPTASEMAENSTCMVCKADWQQTGPICQHCRLGVELEELAPDRVTVNALRILHSLARGPFGRSILNTAERTHILKQAKSFFEVLDAMNRERAAAWRFWRLHLDLMNDLDELRQCKTSMRLANDFENVAELSEDEQNGVVVPCEIHIRYNEHAAKQAMALGDLKRCKGIMNYLKGLGDAENTPNESTEDQRVTCLICLAPFDSDRAVLRCGHSVHVDDCLERLRSRYPGGRTIACPLRCRIRTELSNILVASNQPRHDGTRTEKEVIGSFGTKVTRLLGDIMMIKQNGEKGVVFSQWDDMLEIISSALRLNGIPFVLAGTASEIGKQVNKFRYSDCCVLLLNVKNGGEGLTLLEANHVFMVEPLMSDGLDRQAINRIHRIGQLRKTYVWRYIVEDTVEVKVDAMRTINGKDTTTASFAGHRGGSCGINAGGIDGCFSTEAEVLDLLQP